MCILCVELIKQKMSMDEASRAAGELLFFTELPEDDVEHIYKLKEALDNLDLEALGELL